MKKTVMKVQQGILPFKIEIEGEQQLVTAHAGLALVLEALRALIVKKFWKRLAKALGYKKRGWKVVRRHFESLILLIAAGGRNIDDLQYLRADKGLCELLGFVPSSPTQAKVFLYRFDQAVDGRQLGREESAALSERGKARVREEGPGLRVLEAIAREVVRRQQAERQIRQATLDVDATIVESHKETALVAYDGRRGYQPQMAWWSEQEVWVADEFRDGNVPASYKILEFVKRAFEGLPGSVVRRRLRGDSALYDEKALTWLDEKGIEFVVSAKMSESLAKHIKMIPEEEWKPYKGEEDDGEERQCAEVPDFVPLWNRNRHKQGEAFRYIAIRVKDRQGELFEEQGWRHYAVVTNMDWDAERLLRWHRQKQGTVEQGHNIMKNGLAGGVLPCARFGANAAWWRLNRITHNVIEFMKTTALPAQLESARPKTLRFRLFNLAGRITRSGRRLILHLSASHPLARAIVEARRILAALALRPAPMGASP